MCVCVREREREREKDRQAERERDRERQREREKGKQRPQDALSQPRRGWRGSGCERGSFMLCSLPPNRGGVLGRPRFCEQSEPIRDGVGEPTAAVAPPALPAEHDRRAEALPDIVELDRSLRPR